MALHRTPTVALLSVAALAWFGMPEPERAFAQDAKATRTWAGDGLRLELAPLRLDQVRAFFIGRGFGGADADFIAREGCIFRSDIGSAFDTPGSPSVTVRLDRWRVLQKGRETMLRTRERWAEVWKRRGADESAKVALHWALFPTRQTFGPTDSNWGMLAFGLPPGRRFDLEVHWWTGDVRHEKRFKGLMCGA